ncbi:MAG: protein kinase [Bacillota bacterium]|nr:protein kinase [Bacillota bacterium]
MDNNSEKYIGTMLDGRYEILEVIGTGGMASVYKALCHKLNRYDAIKILHEDMISNKELRKRFHAESHAVAMLSHPNIVSVYDVGHSDELEYIVMELIDGINLKTYLNKHGALPYPEVLDFSIQIAKALSHAHSRGIIHRDIKPQNIMLLKDGLVKVADFGIAALQNDVDMPANQAVGSVHYIAPEQARGGAADGRSDVYSLGIVMYEMLTGTLPYTGNSDVEVAVMHMNTEAVPPRELVPEIPEELERITLKAMSTDIESRYQSAKEMLADLENFNSAEIAAQLKADSDEDEVYTSKKHGRKRKSKGSALTAGIIGVLVVILLAFAFVNRYFLKELFGSPDRVDIPEFVGRYYEDIINDPDYNELFSFTVTFMIDSDTDYGIIIDQNPEAKKSKASVDGGIPVELIVSSGEALPNNGEDKVPVPNVVNADRASAIATIKRAGFEYITVESASSSVTKDYVISTEPSAGEKAPAGTTVKIIVSTGPDAQLVPVPQLKGLSKDAAVAKIENNNLSVGEIKSVQSDLEEGTVIWQSIDSGSEVAAHTKVSLQISSGPAGNEG